MKITLPPRGEIAARGDSIYQQQLRQKLEPGHIGQFAVINVETGEYELDQTHLAASQKAAARWPNGLLYAVRVGSPALAHIGARTRNGN